MQELGFIAAVSLGAIFAASGLVKLRDSNGFVFAVLDYEVLPRRLATLYARSLPPVELLCGLALLVGVTPVPASLTVTALLLSFFAGVAINIVRGRKLDCHCFGSGSSEPLGWVTVVRIWVLLACAAATFGWRGSGLFVPPPSDALPSLLLALALVLILYLLRAVPVQWAVWRITAPAAWKEPRRGRMISLRNEPALQGLRTTVHREGR
jgi:hypothetical protein